MDYSLVMVTNQDGLGTESFPEGNFWPTHNFLINAFENEGIVFDEILIDKSFPSDNAPTRKPRTGLLSHYIKGDYRLRKLLCHWRPTNRYGIGKKPWCKRYIYSQ